MFLKNCEFRLGRKLYALKAKFEFEAFLVNFFSESVADFPINFKYRAHKVIAFFA